MNVIVTAGGSTEPGMPLYEAAQGQPKALIDIGGQPMVQWVLDAFSASNAVERVCVIGLPVDTRLGCAHPLVLLPDQGGMLANIIRAAQEIMRIDPQATHAILASGDIPALRCEMVDWMIQQVAHLDQDFYYSVVERGTMERQFPASRRTYLRLKDVEVCGGDLHCLRLSAASDENPLIKKLIAARKSPLRQASMIGFNTLANLVLRRLSLRGLEAVACQRLGLRGQALISPYSELGMDVDKQFQLEIIQEYIAGRYGRNPAKAEPVRH